MQKEIISKILEYWHYLDFLEQKSLQDILCNAINLDNLDNNKDKKSNIFEKK